MRAVSAARAEKEGMRPAVLFLSLLLSVAVVAQESAPTPTYTKPELRKELLALRDEDQTIRMRWLKDQNNRQLIEEMNALSVRHVARLQEILKETGWPTKTMVGQGGSEAVWLILQHAAPQVIKASLPLMKAAVEHGDVRGDLYAMSVDRDRRNDGLPQIYGSQFDTTGGKCEPQPIEDPQHVDERRKAVGLNPLSEYKEQLCAMYQPQQPHEQKKKE
jgi:hypothetical protein